MRTLGRITRSRTVTSRNTSRPLRLFGWLLALSLTCGCGESGGNGSEAALASGRIGPSGGVIRWIGTESRYSGLELAVPPGALAVETAITIRAVTDALIPDSPYGFALEPSGLVLDVPCTLRLPYDPDRLGEAAATSPDDIVVLHVAGDGSTELLQPLQLDSVGHTVLVTMAHFSKLWPLSTWEYSLLHQETALDTAFSVRKATGSKLFGPRTTSDAGPWQTLGKGSIEDFWSGEGRRNLLLIHGILSNAGTFSDNDDDLVQSLYGDFDNIAIYQYRTGASIEESGRRLAELIASGASSNPNFRTTIIAHSMGGLVARYAIESASDVGEITASKPIGSHVDALITLSTPHLGSDRGRVATFVGKRLAPWIITGALWASPGVQDCLSGLPDPSVLPSPNPKYFLVGSDADKLVGWDSALGVEGVPASRMMRLADQGHLEVHDNARNNQVADQIRQWLSLNEVLSATGWSLLDSDRGPTSTWGPSTDFGDSYKVTVSGAPDDIDLAQNTLVSLSPGDKLRIRLAHTDIAHYSHTTIRVGGDIYGNGGIVIYHDNDNAVRASEPVGQPYEVVWNVDRHVPAGTRIIWQASAWPGTASYWFLGATE